MGKKRKRNEIDDAQFGMNYSSSKFKGERELLDRYGVRGQVIKKPDNRDGDNAYRGSDDVKKDLQKAMSQDYDTRRTLEAAAMSGDKKAKKLIKKGFKSFQAMEDTQDYFKKQHKKEGGGGQFSSVNDYMNLTQSMVQKDRNAQTAAYDEKYAKTTDLNDLKDKLMAQATEEAAAPIEPSDRMAQVEERMESAASGGGNAPPSLFDKDNALPAKADDQADAARNFVEDYKKDVVDGANIKSDISRGISNAARHVRDTYGR